MSSTVLYNESELLDKLKGGDPEAFTALYHHYSGPIFINVLKMVKDEDTAHDIVQELFGRIWQKKESIQIEQSFSGYLYRTGQNLVHDFYRKLKLDERLYRHFKSIITADYSPIEEALTRRENAALLEKTLQQLPPQQQKVYRLCKLEGLSYKEAAEKLGISSFTVKEHIVKANQAIREYLGNNMETTIGIVFLLMFSQSK